MAEPTNDSAKRPPDFRMQITESLAGVVDFEAFAKGKNWLVAALLTIISKVLGWVLTSAAAIAGFLISALVRGEDRAQAAFGEIAAVAISDLFGVTVDPGAMNDRGNRGRRADAADKIGRAVLAALTDGGPGGQQGQLTPSAGGAERYMSMVTQLALEGWLEGWIIEACTVGQLETFGELDDIMAQVLGLGRMTRAVTRPLMDVRVIQPFEWQVNKDYRPKLLSSSEAVRQYVRGRWTREQLEEELARQGFSSDRIEALTNAAARFHSVTDVELLVRAGHWTRDQAIQHLRDQGFERAIAENELVLERVKRIAAFERRLADAAIDAFADGRLERFELDDFLDGSTVDSQERAQLVELAEAKRALRAAPLSSSEARRLAQKLILSVSDYRHALEREGRTLDAILALELELRADMDATRQLEAHRAEQAAEREAERIAREELRATRRAEVEAERARTRRGKESDLERAVIRGRIPIARYAEVLAGAFDADTIGIMVELVEEDRLAYLAEQDRRAAALQRAGRRALDVGALERAVLARQLTIPEFRQRLIVAGFDGADADLLAATLDARVRDRDAAEARRRELEPRAAERSLSLSQLEALVLRGIRAISDYAAALAAAGFGPADVDALVELLERRLEDQAAADAAREAGEARLRETGLSLEQRRRAVLRGVLTLDAFAAELLKSTLTLDAQAILVADLERELAEVEAARRRRDEAEAANGARELPLSVVERAARLGIVSPDDYRARLAAIGLDELDQAIAVDVLLAEVADMQRQRARRDAVAGELAAKGLSLGQFERAVKRNVQSLEAYRAFLIGQGYGADDVVTLVTLLEAELVQKKDALGRRAAIAARLAGAGVDLEALEREVLAGTRTFDSVVAVLADRGISPVDVGLLVGLLVERLEAAVDVPPAEGSEP